MKRGRGYPGRLEENSVNKTGRKNNIFTIILNLLGRISSWKEGKGTVILGKKRDLKNGVGEEYQVVGNFIHH